MHLVWFDRVVASLRTWPKKEDVVLGITALLTEACVALPFAFRTGFAKFQVVPLRGWLPFIVVAAFTPALTEELVFRGAFLPHPDVDDVTALGSTGKLIRLIASVCIFVAYHLSPFHEPKELFRDPRFLALAGILGGVCGISYLQSGSIWVPAMVHYVSVMV